MDLRREMLEEAERSLAGVNEREDILAAVLTGSAAWGNPNPDGDIDILIFSSSARGVLYRYLIPRFCSVRRRTEHGFIPYEKAMENIQKGYLTLISCSLIEQLKNGRVLFQKDLLGDSLIESAKRAKPSPMEVGRLLNEIRDSLFSSKQSLCENRKAESILACRHAARSAVRALLLAREGVGVSKEKHEYRAVKKHLSDSEALSYRKLMDIETEDKESAFSTVKKAIELMQWILEGYSISPKLVEYDTSGQL